MKNFILSLSLTLIASASFAQNLFDPTIAGFENDATSGNTKKKAHVQEMWYGKEDSAFYRTTEVVFLGNASLCVNADLSTEKKTVYFTSMPTDVTTLSAGRYLASMMVNVDAATTITSFNTIIGKNNLSTATWNISGLAGQGWTRIYALHEVTSELDVTDDEIGRYSFRFNVSGTSSKQLLYLDDNTLELYSMATIEGNYLDTYYYGFEAGSDVPDGLFIPAASSSVISFSSEVNTDPKSDLYAIKIDAPSTHTTDISLQLGNKDALDQPGSAKVPAGECVASIQVYMDERNLTSFSTPIQTNTATAVTEFQTITWDIPSDINLGEWVTLSQSITLANDIDTKIQFKIEPSKRVDTNKGIKLYIDNMAFVDKPEVTQADIYSFDAGLTGGTGLWYTSPAGDFFSVTNEKSFSGDYALKFYCTDVNALPTTEAGTGKIQMGIGKSDVDNSYINLDAGDYTLKCMLWVEPGCGVSSVGMNIKTPWVASSFNPSTMATGQWVAYENIISLSEAAVNSNFQFVIKEAGYGEGTFYIDDITFTPTTVTAVDDQAAHGCEVYPNPAYTSVTIKSEQGSRIDIFTLSGKMVKTITNAEAITTISTADYASGIYLVKISNAKGTFTEKLQIK